MKLNMFVAMMTVAASLTCSAQAPWGGPGAYPPGAQPGPTQFAPPPMPQVPGWHGPGVPIGRPFYTGPEGTRVANDEETRAFYEEVRRIYASGASTEVEVYDAYKDPAAYARQRAVAALGLNREAQIAAQCIAENPHPKMAALCIGAQLTVAEVQKCLSDGFGGQGCFGDNNTVVQLLRSNAEAAVREPSPQAAWIRLTTGVSLRAIQANGPLGGKNSELRRLCEQFLGRCDWN